MTKKKPRIRFAGFDEEWERRKIKDICSISTGKSNTQDRVEDGIYPFYVRSPIIERSNRYLFDEEAVLTVGDGVGTGKVFHYVNGKYDLHQRVYRMFNFSNEIIVKYFYYYFSNHFYDRVMAMTAKTSVDSVRYEMIADMDINIPKVQEQKAISTTFEQLDRLITLHQNKYNKLTNIKKAMLEKMFPKNGANVPEIRFTGFTKDWERRKLEEVVDIYDGVHQTPEYKDSGIMFLSVENITTLKSNKYISEESFKKDYKVYPQKGDILMTRIGDVGTPNVVETMEKLAFYVSLALLKPTNIESYFLCNAIQSSLFQKRLRDRTLITAIPQKINKEEIGKIDIILSTFVQEQRQIGAFFKQLDKLIALHQKRVEKLQSIKKACIEKMFV